MGGGGGSRVDWSSSSWHLITLVARQSWIIRYLDMLYDCMIVSVDKRGENLGIGLMEHQSGDMGVPCYFFFFFFFFVFLFFPITTITTDHKGVITCMYIASPHTGGVGQRMVLTQECAYDRQRAFSGVGTVRDKICPRAGGQGGTEGQKAEQVAQRTVRWIRGQPGDRVDNCAL